MTEAQFQDKVADLARMCGWRVHHQRPGRTNEGWRTTVMYDGKGFPDLVLVHPRGWVVFAELKSAKGTFSADQKMWQNTITAALDGINTARVQYRAWRPVDWPEIERLLTAVRTTSD